METQKEKTKYIEAVGRRKTSIARIRLVKGTKGQIEVNNQDWKKYFPTLTLQHTAKGAFTTAAADGIFNVSAKIIGGGIASQAEAFRLGVARALIKYDAALRLPLKQAGLITRDGRIKERRKFGLKKARKAPQWSKR